MKKSQLTNLTLSIFILMAFVLAMSAMLFNGILDKVAKELQISISETGLLSSAYAYGAAIGVPILLILFRKMERTKALKIMLFTTIVATTWMMLAPDFIQLLLARFMAGIAANSYGVLATATVADFSPKEKLGSALARLIMGSIYDDVLEPTEREMDLVRQYALVDEQHLKKVYDLKLPFLTQDQDALLKNLFFEPSINIQGVQTGYQGQGVKTILPAEASAKLEVRLVPGMKPRKVFQQIQDQLIRNGFDQIQLTYTLGEEGYRSDMTVASILKVIDIAGQFSPEGVAVLPTTAGTGPMHQVFEALEVPIAAFGIGNPNSRDHGGDENVKIADYLTHINMIEELIRSYE